MIHIIQLGKKYIEMLVFKIQIDYNISFSIAVTPQGEYTVHVSRANIADIDIRLKKFLACGDLFLSQRQTCSACSWTPPYRLSGVIPQLRTFPFTLPSHNICSLISAAVRT